MFFLISLFVLLFSVGCYGEPIIERETMCDKNLSTLEKEVDYHIYDTKEYDFTNYLVANGSWDIRSQGLWDNNATEGDCFFMSNIRAEKGEYVMISADFEITRGTALAVLFSV